MIDMIDMTKAYTTRHGAKVRILCTDEKGAWPVVGIIRFEHVADHGGQELAKFKADGKYGNSEHPFDLVEVKEPFDAWWPFFKGKYVISQEASKLVWEAAIKWKESQ